MSGNFVMCGELVIYNKFICVKMVLLIVDLVIELLVIVSLLFGDYFVELVVKVVDYMSVDIIVFGSENNDIKILK